jgi:hypothetical protein
MDKPLQPGIHQMTADTYHADPCPEPSLSSSIAKTLLGYSPLHASTEHPRLNPGLEREQKDIFDLGTAAHAYFLEGEMAFAIIEAKDWRTKAAQEARDAARAEGKTPILAYRWQDIQEMGEALRAQLEVHAARPRPFTAGKAEQVVIWKERGVWCRARLDWLHDDYSAIDDLKTGALSANPDAWSRTLFGAGHDIQEAFYRRGVKAVTDRDPQFRFVPQENFRPFAASVIGLAPAAQELAARKVTRAIELWGACLQTGRWPGYPTQTCYAEPLPWLEAQWEERELREEGIRDDGRPIGEQLAGLGDR